MNVNGIKAMVVGQALCNALMALGGGVRLIILLFIGNRKAMQARGQKFQMFRFNDREARRRRNMAHLRGRRGKEGLVCHRIDAAIPQKVKKKEKKKERNKAALENREVEAAVGWYKLTL